MLSLERNTEAMGDLVPEYVKHIKEFLTYQGDNPKYYQKAKVSAVGLGAYVKAEGTLTNRMALRQAAERSSKELPA